MASSDFRKSILHCHARNVHATYFYSSRKVAVAHCRQPTVLPSLIPHVQALIHALLFDVRIPLLGGGVGSREGV